MISMDSIALTALLEYWKEHDVEIVCIAYAELKKRDFPIDQRIQRKINAFCNKHGVANMEEFVGRMLAKKDFHRYDAVFNTETDFTKRRFVGAEEMPKGDMY